MIDRRTYPKGWRRRSREYRRQVAGDKCEHCGIGHGAVVAAGPDLRSEYPATRIKRIWINAAHRYHTTDRSEDADLIALCPRCHAYYDLADIQTKKRNGLHYAGPHQLNLFTAPADRFTNP